MGSYLNEGCELYAESVNGIPIFNPRSIVQLCLSRRFANYWALKDSEACRA